MNAAAFAAVGAGAMLGAWARGRLPGKYLAACMHSAAHLFGAILATFLGFATYRALA